MNAQDVMNLLPGPVSAGDGRRGLKRKEAGPSAAGSANAMVDDSASAWGRHPAAYHVAPGSHVCGWQQQMPTGMNRAGSMSMTRLKPAEFREQHAPWNYEAAESRRQSMGRGAPVDRVLADLEEEAEEVGCPWCLSAKCGNLRTYWPLSDGRARLCDATAKWESAASSVWGDTDDFPKAPAFEQPYGLRTVQGHRFASVREELRFALRHSGFLAKWDHVRDCMIGDHDWGNKLRCGPSTGPPLPPPFEPPVAVAVAPAHGSGRSASSCSSVLALLQLPFVQSLGLGSGASANSSAATPPPPPGHGLGPGASSSSSVPPPPPPPPPPPAHRRARVGSAWGRNH